jgi:hypothetical protein
MKTYRENDYFRLEDALEGDVIGERRKFLLPAGTTVTVLLVHGEPENPVAYELEAYIKELDIYVIATIEGENLRPGD